MELFTNIKNQQNMNGTMRLQPVYSVFYQLQNLDCEMYHFN